MLLLEAVGAAVEQAREFGFFDGVEQLAADAAVPASAVTRPEERKRQFSDGPNALVFDAPRFRSESGGGGEMIEELRAVKKELAQLNAAQERNNEDTKRAADRLDGRQGTPFLVQVAV